MLVITVSIAILDDSRGGIRCRCECYCLKVIANMVNKIKVLKTGFALLASTEVMALSLPPAWSTNLNGYATYRIYDIPSIGISIDE